MWQVDEMNFFRKTKNQSNNEQKIVIYYNNCVILLYAIVFVENSFNW